LRPRRRRRHHPLEQLPQPIGHQPLKARIHARSNDQFPMSHGLRTPDMPRPRTRRLPPAQDKRPTCKSSPQRDVDPENDQTESPRGFRLRFSTAVLVVFRYRVSLCAESV
jgi:hypothetical protein